MSDAPLSDLTFLNGVINNTRSKSKIIVSAEFKKAPDTPEAEKKKPRKFTSKQKENPSEVEKTPRKSTRNQREPLKVLNVVVKSPKGKVSPSKNGSGVRTRRSAPKSDPVPAETKPGRKSNRNVPKIIVHEDAENKTKRGRGFSKSWDGSDPPGQRSDGSAEAPAENKKVRRSTSDLASAGQTSTAAKPRLSKFKPGQPEFDETALKLENLFPNIDPDFVRSSFVKLKGSLPETIEFLMGKEKNKEAPTRVDYLRRQMVDKLTAKFLAGFNVESFVKMIPEPWDHFSKNNRQNSASYVAHSFHYLKNKYKTHYTKTIEAALKKNDCSLYLTDKELKKNNPELKMRATNRSKNECDAGRPTTFDIIFLHEVAFIENKAKIKSYIKKIHKAKCKKRKEAEEAGILLDCQSCFCPSLLPDDAVNCPANHVFCKDCIVKYVQIVIEKSSVKFKCLVKCDETISLEFLQAVLAPTVMANIIERNRQDENTSEQLKDLFYCPYCYFVTLMSPESRTLKCSNPSCRLDTCRECQQVNHFPLKCHEIRNFDMQVLEAITKRKNQGEEEKTPQKKDIALKCFRCNGDFLKVVDSNQMICHCGVTICSICHAAFPECEHVDPEDNKQTFHRLSDSSDSSDVSNILGNLSEDDLDFSSTTSNESLDFTPSESQAF